MKILVADDDPIALSILQATLRRLGDDVIAVTNGHEALAIMQQTNAPKIAFLDVSMPELSGIQVCRKLRRETHLPSTYIVLLASGEERASITEGLDAGADDFLVKPLHVEELRGRLQAGKRIIGLQNFLMDQINNLQDALSQVKTLEALLPICSHCQRVRDTVDYWQKLEAYMLEHADDTAFHSACPVCVHKRNLEEDGETV